MNRSVRWEFKVAYPDQSYDQEYITDKSDQEKYNCSYTVDVEEAEDSKDNLVLPSIIMPVVDAHPRYLTTSFLDDQYSETLRETANF